MLTSRPIYRNGEGIQRFGGAKTPARGLQNENALRNAPNTLGKGNMKGNLPQTPFQPKSIKGEAPQTGKGKAPIQLNTISRPFLDKTPFPNRIVSLHTQTPLNGALSETPESAKIPSSTRKHIRLPRHSQKFETPLNTKNHWDLSDNEVETIITATPLKVQEVKEDYDEVEVEYMPPNTLDLPYQPPLDFELPNYKEVGKVLMSISRNVVFDEPQSPLEFVPNAEDIAQIPWNMIPLPELEDDDPFGAAQKTKPSATRATESVMRKISKPIPVPAVRHTRSASSTTRHGISSSVIHTNRHTRTTSVSTHNTRITPRPVITTGRAPSTDSVRSSSRAAAKTTAPAPRRPATSASTYKPTLPPVRGVSKSSQSSIAIGPVSLRRQVTASRVINAKAEEDDTISFKTDLLKNDENEDFLFDV
ncbi:hypothetical protein L218DRAFT_964170 [Marasmius fiardii PR-910]|nr:hypothetical protein L218DRAFT_964170 [Marasmius fiardii PR-910]